MPAPARGRAAVAALPTADLLKELALGVQQQAGWASTPAELRRYFGELRDELGDEFPLFAEEIIWSGGLARPAGVAAHPDVIASQPGSPPPLAVPELEPEPGPEPELKPEPELEPELEPEPESLMWPAPEDEPDPEVRSVLLENEQLRRKVAARDEEMLRLARRLDEVTGVAPRVKASAAAARPRSAPSSVGKPGATSPASSRRPGSARSAAQHGRMYARDLERRAVRDAATATAREQQAADEMREATFSPVMKPRLPAWYKRVNPNINLCPQSVLRSPRGGGTTTQREGAAAAAAAKPAVAPRQPLQLTRQPQPTVARRVQGKQVHITPRRGGRGKVGAASRPPRERKTPKRTAAGGESAPPLAVAAEATAPAAPAASPTPAELEQLGWRDAHTPDGQTYWFEVSSPAELHWDLPPRLMSALGVLRDGGAAKARWSAMPSTAALDAAGKSAQLDNMMNALGVSLV